MSHDLLVTGFGSFGAFESNPSQWLAERSGHSFRVLEVAFREVDRFLEELREGPPARLLLLGAAAGASKLRVEWVARNRVGAAPDVRGEVYGPGPIDPDGPPCLAATLWPHEPFGQPSELWEPSVDAGTYLCNYAFYRSLRTLPRTAVGFLHVPGPEAMALERQLEALRAVLAELNPA
ncbi:MAG: hypothetical protein N2109_13450 [Fimbriimonadales bacterium]|nr:hypothetical protein [Fimbriimonadales bacterium]